MTIRPFDLIWSLSTPTFVASVALKCFDPQSHDNYTYFIDATSLNYGTS